MTGIENETVRPVPGLVQALAHRAAFRLRRDLAEHDMAGVRPLHAPLLARLLGGASRAADLASATGVSRQAIAQVIANLERDGYVMRIPDPCDSRAKLVCLTTEGRAVLRFMRTSYRGIEGEWLERIGHERLSVLRDILADLLGTPDDRHVSPRG